MIRVEMHGRLGNQLFQYAAARELQELTNQDMIFSFRQVTRANTEGTSGWENSLVYFNTKKYELYEGNSSLLFYKNKFIQIISGLFYAFSYKRYLKDFQKCYLYQKKWCFYLDKIGIRWIANGYYNFVHNTCTEYLLNGTFEAPEYFKDIRHMLLEELTPKKEPLRINYFLYDKIYNTESVCLSVRHFKLKGEQAKLYDVCSLQYYKTAIKEIKKNVKNPFFIVFSDDIQWAKENLDLENCDYLFETDNNPIWEKLRLMYSCKHFIISNSTFSWWAQYLSRNNNKIVVSPNKWFNNEFISPLINVSWIRVDKNGKVV